MLIYQSCSNIKFCANNLKDCEKNKVTNKKKTEWHITFCFDSFFTGVMLVSGILKTTCAQDSCKLDLSLICTFLIICLSIFSSWWIDSCYYVWPTGHSFFSHMFVNNTPAVQLNVCRLLIKHFTAKKVWS